MPRIGCAGILVADTFCGPMQALPMAGELLVIDAMLSRAGGCAANVAIDLALQGLEVEIAGCVGNNNASNGLVAELKSFGVGCARIVRCADLPTSRTVILVTENEDRRYIHTFGANAAFGVADIDRNWVSGLDLFYLGGLFALPAIDFSPLSALLQHCRASGTMTIVDVVVPGFKADVDLLDPLLPHIDYFVPNGDEARVFTRLMPHRTRSGTCWIRAPTPSSSPGARTAPMPALATSCCTPRPTGSGPLIPPDLGMRSRRG